MKIFDSENEFGLLSIVLHWLTAVMVTGLFVLGLWMSGLDYYHPWYFRAPQLHMTLGMLVLIVVILRIVLRLIRSRPAIEQGIGLFETMLAFGVQNALYLLLLGIVLTGYLSATADGQSVDMFGRFELPAMISGLPNQADVAREVHRWLVYGLLVLIALHVAGALKHHFINRNRTLRRIVSGWGK